MRWLHEHIYEGCCRELGGVLGRLQGPGFSPSTTTSLPPRSTARPVPSSTSLSSSSRKRPCSSSATAVQRVTGRS
jgi:hypothetical protein